MITPESFWCNQCQRRHKICVVHKLAQARPDRVAYALAYLEQTG